MAEIKCFPESLPTDSDEPTAENSGFDRIEPDPEGDLLEKWLRLAEAALKKKTRKDTQPTG